MSDFTYHYSYDASHNGYDISVDVNGLGTLVIEDVRADNGDAAVLTVVGAMEIF